MRTKRLLTMSFLGLGFTLTLLWFLSTTPSQTVHAAILNPNVLYDENDGDCSLNCSLRDAILIANGNGQADIIVLNSGTYTLSITGTDEDACISGDLDITSTLTIVGQGPTQTYIDARGIDRVFDIQPGAGSVVISGVTLFNGNVAGHGGGIYNEDAHLTLINTIVSSNTASTNGGGVYLAYGSATLSASQITSNTAGNAGGGVLVSLSGASFTQTGVSMVAHNAATHGGGIYISFGDATLSGGQVYSNTAQGYGGGAYTYGGTITLDGGHVLSNTASRGGGIYLTGAPAVVTQAGDSTIAYNAAKGTDSWDGGGGIYIYRGSVTLGGGQILGNRANRGGGVYALYQNAVLTQTGASTITHNTATRGGGGVYLNEGTMTLSGGQVLSNTANYGGGVNVNLSTGRLDMSGGQIVDNKANNWGGGVYVGDGTVVFSGGQVVSNTASSGGGIQLGGPSATLTQTGASLIAHNTANSGGGVYVNYGHAVLLGGEVFDNRADNSGGGIQIFTGSGRVDADGSKIVSNTAAHGGGLFVQFGSATLGSSVVISNSAEDNGGGLYNSLGTLTAINTTLSGNEAVSGSGGALYVDGGTTVLTYTTIASNTAPSGGGIARLAGTVVVHNSIVAYNGPSNCAGAITSNGYNLEDGDTCGLLAGIDITGTDPLLLQLADNGGGTLTHALPEGSPAVDAGLCVAGVTVDQRGQPRPNPVSPFCDIGAFESGSIGTADLAIAKAATAASVIPGGEITFTLSFTNLGPAATTGVVITDLVPISVTVQQVISNGVAITDTGTSPGYVWQVQPLYRGQGGTITITVVVSDTLSPSILSNTALIAGRATDDDSSSGSNTATVEVTVAEDQYYTYLPIVLRNY